MYIRKVGTRLRFQVSVPCYDQVVQKIDRITTCSLKELLEREDRRLLFVIHELLINAYESTILTYADNAPKYPIEVLINIDEQTVSVHVSDYGYGMNEDALVILDQELDGVLMQERGRGLLMVKKLVDKMYFSKKESGIFTVSIEKRWN